MAGIDLHTHLAPDLAGLHLSRMYITGSHLPGGPVPGVEPGPPIVVDGRPIGPDDLYAPDRLVAYLDRAGLDHAVVTVPPPFYRSHLSAADAAAWARSLNDGLLVATAGRERLLPAAYLPLEHPAVAVAEYDRVAGDSAWAGFSAGLTDEGCSLADPALAPLWERLDAGSRTLLLHPAGGADPRLEPFYLHNLLGNPVRTALAAAELVFSDTLRRHPQLRVVLMHAGGAVPALAGRWQRGAETARPGLDPAAEPPAQALRRLTVDCLAFHPGVLDLAVDVFGADRIVLGTDWPFPMSVPDPRDLVAHRGPAFVEQVAVTNALALGLVAPGQGAGENAP